MNLQDALANTNQNAAQPSAIIAKESYRAVDISIAGTPHRIVSPVDAIKNLESAAEHINQKIRDLRREIKNKNPSNEEFLVLVCLEMYDQIQALQKQLGEKEALQKQAQLLIEKIGKEARTML